MSRIDRELVARLERIARVRLDEPLGRHTTFGIGGPADAFVTVRNADELAQAVVAAREFAAPYFVLGSGSNILVGDGGIRGVVINNQAKRVEGPLATDREHIVQAESGASFAALARSLARDGWAGIEWAGGIPGTLGGAVVYNAGAYDGCLADVLRSVLVLDAANDLRTIAAADLGMRYRSTAFTRREIVDAIVLRVEFAVRRGDPKALVGRVSELDTARLTSQPRGRNSGSTFKNPPGRSAWELIDAVGLRGKRIGDARISEKHCNFFENLGGARAADVYALMQEAQRLVRERYGIELEREVELVGEGFAFEGL